MKRIGAVTLIGVVLAGAVLAAPAAQAADGPPISGSMEAFDVRAEPRQMPETPFRNDGNEERTLAAFRGQVILVNFWATWCTGSWRELPTLERLQGTLGSDQFAVVIMSQDLRGWEVIEPFLKKRRFDFAESYFDEDFKLGDAIDLAPQMGSILIDRNGREVGRLDGPTDWDTPEAAALIQYYLDSAGHGA